MARAMTPHKWNEGTLPVNYVANRRPISDMFNSLLVKTADTGQVNWATVPSSMPPNPPAVRDYEIYRLNDALQATAPIFIRVDYMALSSGAERYAAMQFSVGTATDGAGNLRGVTTPPMMCNSSYINATAPAPPWNAYASTDGSQLVFFWGVTPPHLLSRTPTFDSWSGVVIERFRNADGTANAEGYTAWLFDSTGVSQNQAGLLKGQYSRVFAGGGSDALDLVTMMPVAWTSYFGDNTAYAAAVHHFGPTLRGPSQAWLIGFNSDFPRATEVTVPHSGRQSTFMSIGSAGTTQLPYTSSTDATQPVLKYAFAPLLRWE